MFGYITTLKPELKIKDYDLYRSYYCGLCRSLRRRYGPAAQITLSYDMTFMALLLSALYEPESSEGTTWCLAHPGSRHPLLKNRFVDYAADMNLLLGYYDLADDWKDEKKLLAGAGSAALRKKAEKLVKGYPRQGEAVKSYVEKLTTAEAQNSPDLDLAAGLTGHMLGEIFVPEEDVWAPYLRKLGFYLGKFIYLMDAYEDLEQDKKHGNYNPWLARGESRIALREDVRDILTMMMSECSLAFEHLPIIKNGDILRNILYAGVWCRFEWIASRDSEKAKKEASPEEAGKEETPDDV